jgi:hypothetical protein
VDLPSIILHLRQQREDIDQAILSIERLLAAQPRGRGRPRKNPFLESRGAAETNMLPRKMRAIGAVD